MSKKAISIILVFAMVFSFAACVETKNVENTPQEPSKQVEAAQKIEIKDPDGSFITGN